MEIGTKKLGCRNLEKQVGKCIFVAKSFIYFCNCSCRVVLTIIFCHYNLTEKRKCFSQFSFEEGNALLLPPKSLIYFYKSILSARMFWQIIFCHYNLKEKKKIFFLISSLKKAMHFCCHPNYSFFCKSILFLKWQQT